MNQNTSSSSLTAISAAVDKVIDQVSSSVREAGDKISEVANNATKYASESTSWTESFGWSEQHREHLEVRARRFLKNYLSAEETGKPQYYRAVDEFSRKCQPPVGLSQTDMDDNKIAEAASLTAFQIVLDLEERSAKDDRVNEFVTDACATVAVAYHRAAGVYVADEKMQKLGTAAVHLLTMASSYIRNEHPADKHGV